MKLAAWANTARGPCSTPFEKERGFPAGWLPETRGGLKAPAWVSCAGKLFREMNLSQE